MNKHKHKVKLARLTLILLGSFAAGVVGGLSATMDFKTFCERLGSLHETALSSSGASAPNVTGLALAESGTDKVHGALADGQTLRLAPGETFNIAAETSPGTGSVVFYLNGARYRAENSPPYAMGMDSNGVFSEWLLPPGRHVVEAVAYAKDNGEGQRGGSARVEIEIEPTADVASPPPASARAFDVSGLMLVKIESGEALELRNGSLLNLHKTGPVRIQSAGNGAGSIQYFLDGAPYRIENLGPGIAADPGALQEWPLSSGLHHILAVPYSGPNATGEAGRSTGFHFGVVNGGSVDATGPAGDMAYDESAMATGAVASAKPAAAKAGKLRWPRPSMSKAETISVGTSKNLVNLNLDTKKDYYVTLPKVKWEGGVNIVGGRNIIIVGGHIVIPGSTRKKEIRGIYVRDNLGTVHIEGVYFEGKGEGDAIAIASPKSIVQIQNCRMDKIKGSEKGLHGDIVQPWGGVKQLRIHNLTGSSDYQGLQINRDDGVIGKSFVSNVNLTALKERFKGAKGGYMLWTNDYPIEFKEVYITPREGSGLNKTVYPENESGGTASWSYAKGVVKKGRPPGGDFVPPGVAGLKYK